MIRASVIGYTPIIAVNCIRGAETVSKFGRWNSAAVLDKVIYALAQEIISPHAQKFKQVVLRLGGFHTSMTMMSVIGKHFTNSGLESILVGSGVVGPSAVHGVMSGKHYNRALRCHQIVMEALF